MKSLKIQGFIRDQLKEPSISLFQDYISKGMIIHHLPTFFEEVNVHSFTIRNLSKRIKILPTFHSRRQETSFPSMNVFYKVSCMILFLFDFKLSCSVDIWICVIRHSCVSRKVRLDFLERCLANSSNFVES